MANTPRLSSVTSSSNFSPRTPYSIDQSLFQSPPRNRPELGGFKMEPTPQRAIFYDSSPPRLQSPQRVKSAFRKRSTLEADLKMKRMSPYKHHTSPQSPEVGFAMRLGRASHSLPTFDDVVKLSNELFNKYYIAKLASRDCIVSCISVTLREIDALEKMKDFLVESQKQEKEQLAAASKELELFVKEAKARNSSVMPLTAADKQLSQLLALSNHDSILGDLDTDTRDDVVYEDDEDERSEDEKDDSQLYDTPAINQRTQKFSSMFSSGRNHRWIRPFSMNTTPTASSFVTYPQSTDLPFPPALTTSGGSQSTPPATHPHYPSQLAQPDLDPFLSSSQSTSQVRMEHLPTMGTSHTLYTNPLVPIRAGCNYKTCTTSSAPARAASFTKEQMKALHAMTKNNICRYMFNEEAVPRTRLARDSALRDAVSMASNTLFGCDPPPVVKLRPWCVDVMWGIRDAFRQYAKRTIDIFFDLLPPLESDEDEAETRHPNDYDVFHLKEAGTTKYFQHDSIRRSIAYVVWWELQCPEVLNADTMAPLITLTSTCLLVALESRVSKVHDRTLGEAEHFTHTYREIRSFIDTVVLANETNHQSFVAFCSLIISQTKARDLDVSYVDDDF
ncbi:hypothetical protein EDD16DRAFT_1524180 [Pisolithus croceorrhizus]|nr:hypothetical protein EDD16DRAFT_1524180 [Pisolithus croceorrhizus]